MRETKVSSSSRCGNIASGLQFFRFSKGYDEATVHFREGSQKSLASNIARLGDSAPLIARYFGGHCHRHARNNETVMRKQAPPCSHSHAGRTNQAAFALANFVHSCLFPSKLHFTYNFLQPIEKYATRARRHGGAYVSRSGRRSLAHSLINRNSWTANDRYPRRWKPGAMVIDERFPARGNIDALLVNGNTAH